jgi:hypothetical protein
VGESEPARRDQRAPNSEAQTRLLLAEYSEAGAQCRNQDLLTRTNNLVFMAFFVAMTGLMEKNDNDLVDALVYGALGIVGSLLFLHVGLRTRAQYTVYMQRAREIETALGFDLFLRDERLLRARRIPVLGISLTNKTVFSSIQVAAAAYFIVKLTAFVR